ncbi:MAG: GDSL-type esterase/lipase family protein [Candidatus Saccharimonadales bacterium]
MEQAREIKQPETAKAKSVAKKLAGLAIAAGAVLAGAHPNLDPIYATRQPVTINATCRKTCQPNQKPNMVVSLGDSVAGGNGLPAAVNAGPVAKACHDSPEAAVYSTAAKLNLRADQLACSGASLKQGVLKPQAIGSLVVPAQLARARGAIAGNIVTVSVGADDVAWQQMVADCLTSDCQTNKLGREFDHNIAAFRPAFNNFLHQLNSDHPAEVIVNQYYQALPADGGCYSFMGLASNKFRNINNDEHRLNQVIGSVTRINHDTLVQPNFGGHGLCSGDPWLQGFTNSAPLHPNYMGQQEIAIADEAAINPEVQSPAT